MPPLTHQKGGRGRFLLVIQLFLIKGTQGCTKPSFPDKQVFIVYGIAGGRALLQVEDCPTESVEKLRGEVDDEYSLSITQYYITQSLFYAQLDRLGLS